MPARVKTLGLNPGDEPQGGGQVLIRVQLQVPHTGRDIPGDGVGRASNGAPRGDPEKRGGQKGEGATAAGDTIHG